MANHLSVCPSLSEAAGSFLPKECPASHAQVALETWEHIHCSLPGKGRGAATVLRVEIDQN